MFLFLRLRFRRATCIPQRVGVTYNDARKCVLALSHCYFLKKEADGKRRKPCEIVCGKPFFFSFSFFLCLDCEYSCVSESLQMNLSLSHCIMTSAKENWPQQRKRGLATTCTIGEKRRADQTTARSGVLFFFKPRSVGQLLPSLHILYLKLCVLLSPFRVWSLRA